MNLKRPPSATNSPTRAVLLYKSYLNKDNKTKAKQKTSPFLKGPVPWEWLIIAGKLNGKALALGLYIWFLSGIRKTDQIEINLKRFSESTGASRRSLGRALSALADAHLIETDRHTGRKAKIKILSVKSNEEGDRSHAGNKALEKLDAHLSPEHSLKDLELNNGDI